LLRPVACKGHLAKCQSCNVLNSPLCPVCQSLLHCKNKHRPRSVHAAEALTQLSAWKRTSLESNVPHDLTAPEHPALPENARYGPTVSQVDSHSSSSSQVLSRLDMMEVPCTVSAWLDGSNGCVVFNRMIFGHMPVVKCHFIVSICLACSCDCAVHASASHG